MDAKFVESKNFLRIPLVESSGKLIEEIVYRNTIFPVFHPDACVQDPDAEEGKAGSYPLIMVQWGMKDGKKTGDVKIDDMASTLEFQGKVYIVDRYAGTNVKQQRTLGVRYDIVPFFQEWIKLAEQSTKVNRAAIPMGMALYTPKESLSVLYVNDGWEYGDYLVVDDGFLIIADDTLPEYSGPRVKFSWGNQNLQVWQDIDVSSNKVRAEIQDAIRKYYETVGSKLDIAREVWEKSDTYQRLIDANPVMARHPYTIQRVSNQHKEWFCRRLTTVPLQMRLGVAAPLPSDIDYLPTELKTGVFAEHRFPKTSTYGTTIARVKRITKRMREYWEFLRARDGFQGTFSSLRESWKFVAIRVPRRMMPPGVDIITSRSNVKLGKKRMETIDRHLKSADASEGYLYEIPVEDMPTLTVLQYYAAGSFKGVNMRMKDKDGNPIYNSWKIKSGDVDGDNVFEMDLTRYPAIAEAFERSYTEHPVVSMKAKKTKTHVSRTSALLTNAFLAGSLVGLWTNLRGWYLALTPEKRELFASRASEEHLLMDHEGNQLEPTHDGALKLFGDMIQECVDAPKSITCDMWESRKKAQRAQSILSGISGKGPGFNHFRRSRVAGVTALPYIEDEMPAWMVARAEIDRDFRNSDVWKDMTPLSLMDSTIGFLMRENKPHLEKLFAENVGDEALPLSEFAGWAGAVRREWVDKAEEVFFEAWAEFDAKSKRLAQKGLYDMGDPEEVAARHQEWQLICQDFADKHFKGDRRLAAKALWVAAHQTNRGSATAALVFVGFPDEAYEIVSGGVAPQTSLRTVVVGVDRHFGCKPPVTMTVQVKVVERTDSKGRGRKVIVADKSVPMLRKEGGDGFPDWTLGCVAALDKRQIRAGFIVPEPGSYNMTLRRDGAAYIAEMELVG